MQPLHDVFLLAGDPYRVYRNTFPSFVGGMRLNPQQRPQLVPFLVPGSGQLVTYDHDDDRVFQTLNKSLFDQGIFVVEYERPVETKRRREVKHDRNVS